MPEDSGLCVDCFYYHQPGRDAKWFWSRQNDYLFPYNIGQRVIMAASGMGAKSARQPQYPPD